MNRLSFFLTFILVLALVGGNTFAQSGCEFTVSNVTGLASGKLNAKIPTHTYTIHGASALTCADSPCYNTVNGFIIYSPDGATFDNLDAAFLPAWDAMTWTQVFINGFLGNMNQGQCQSNTPGVLSPSTKPISSGGLDAALAFNGVSFNPLQGWPSPFAGDVFDIQFDVRTIDDGLHICLDSTFTPPGGSWKWASLAGGNPVYPDFNSSQGAYCLEIWDVPNLPPDVIDPTAGNYSFNHCVVGTIDFDAVDPESDTPIEFAISSGPGIIDINSGVWSWSGGSVPQQGADVLQVYAKDPTGSGTFGPVATVNLTVTNDPPTIDCPGILVTAPADDATCQVVHVTDDCDNLTLSAGIWDPQVVFTDLGGGDWEVCFTPVPPAMVVTMPITVDDGGTPKLSASCDLLWNVIEGAPYAIEIEKIKDQVQGVFTEVDVILHKIDPTMGFGGFDILIAYDQSALSFQQALEGDIYGACNWEYFTYRFGPYGNCGNQCPSGMVRVIGMAETNNGPVHPDCDTPDPGYVQEGQLPITLFKLVFLVSNDRNLECQFVPVRFFWYDCGDNVLSNHDGSELYVSFMVFDFDEYGAPFSSDPINNGTIGFPTYLGAQDYCLDGTPFPDKPVPIRFVDFQNGGVDIVCADSIDARGDVNLNGIAYEIADAVMFTNYFVKGLDAFTHVDGSIAATDCNADGLVLTVGDLVYLIRVVVGDALPYPKLNPTHADFAYENGVVSIDAEMGAAFLVFEGAVTPTLLADNMEMMYGVVDGNTRVLVYSTDAGAAFNGDFIAVNGDLVGNPEFATYEGQPVVVQKVAKTFQLEQNYPNPFNPKTTIAFQIPGGGEYKLAIYNITGQLVYEVSGYTDGFGAEEWDASENASGIYFYKLVTDNYTATQKAVLLK